MSFRLDEGHGTCTYRIGVEDDGCHSLLSYEEISESARILECLARSLNAVVLERKIIQNEVVVDEETGDPVKSNEKPVVAYEEPILGDANGKKKPIQNEGDVQLLRKDGGVYTRAELKIQRVETHLLDPSPIAAAELSNSDGNENIEPTTTPSSKKPTSDNEGGVSAAKKLNSNTEAEEKNAATSEQASVGETLSLRCLRVAVVGNVDAGKSTLIGSLTTSTLDDGRGKCRSSIMKHRHELESGRTSTATTHLMGFKSDGQLIKGKDQIRTNKRKGEDEIAREAYRVITLMDLAGHEKYLKTT